MFDLAHSFRSFGTCPACSIVPRAGLRQSIPVKGVEGWSCSANEVQEREWGKPVLASVPPLFSLLLLCLPSMVWHCPYAGWVFPFS